MKEKQESLQINDTELAMNPVEEAVKDIKFDADSHSQNIPKSAIKNLSIAFQRDKAYYIPVPNKYYNSQS